ncbi:hypothetical protein Tco_0919567, partial [Tanacetum coccineum]
MGCRFATPMDTACLILSNTVAPSFCCIRRERGQKKDKVKVTNGSTVVGSISKLNEPITENEEDMGSLTAKNRVWNVKSLKVHVTDPCMTTLGTISGVNSSNKHANFCVFETSIPTSDKAAVQILMLSVSEANARFKNSLYGYFLGKRVAFPIVEHYLLTEDCLSAIVSKLWKLVMLDAYTSSMCMQSWGRLNFAPTLIDLRVEHALKSYMVIAVPALK